MNKLVLLTFVLMTLGALQTQAQEVVKDSVCTLSGEGVYGAYWKKHRLMVKDQAVYGADDMQSVIEALKKARSEGRCAN